MSAQLGDDDCDAAAAEAGLQRLLLEGDEGRGEGPCQPEAGGGVAEGEGGGAWPAAAPPGRWASEALQEEWGTAGGSAGERRDGSGGEGGGAAVHVRALSAVGLPSGELPRGRGGEGGVAVARGRLTLGVTLAFTECSTVRLGRLQPAPLLEGTAGGHEGLDGEPLLVVVKVRRASPTPVHILI